MVPLSPTAQPRVLLLKKTPCRFAFCAPSGASCSVHVCPPSSVLRMVPPSPTAQPLLTFKKCTPCKAVVTPPGGVCGVQVSPSSVVLRMVPPSPTAQAVCDPLLKKTACRFVITSAAGCS